MSPAYIYDIEIPDDATIELPTQHGCSCALFAVYGTGNCNGTEAIEDTIINFDSENGTIEFSALKNTRVVVFGG